MKQNRGLKYSIALFYLVLFAVIASNKAQEMGHTYTMMTKTIEDVSYRKLFFSDTMRQDKNTLSVECKDFIISVEKEAVYFPIPESTVDKSKRVTFVDTWMSERKYKGTAGHEGTDIMASINERGAYPVLSVSDGIVTNIGWLEKGGYRIGITSNSGTYYYYAHLDSYGNIKKGDSVQAGEFIGYMGDSGYGEEGTKGEFPVHLHFGIYRWKDGKEISFNPYYVLKFLENKKLKYAYF